MTATRESSFLSFTPHRTSFDNLIVLANYEERLKVARKIVWRDRGEPAIDIHNLRQCLLHGARGGLRMSPSLLSWQSRNFIPPFQAQVSLPSLSVLV